MNRQILSALALTLSGLAAMAAAIVPMEEAPAAGRIKKAALSRVPVLTTPGSRAEARNTFFEGFEDRPEGYTMSTREWLPDGWQDVSKSGHTATSTPHNLTWQVLDEESKNLIGPVVQNGAHAGYAFAYIMADVAYGDHHDLDVQDEWLITPSIVPTDEDWLYFKLFFSPGWTLYNRATNDFTGQNNSLEVYASEDDGENWEKIWSLIDDHISKEYTDEQLRASLIDVDNTEYTSMYVDIHRYAGKTVKFAFRYFGNLGQPVALDNVAVGLPQPVASFKIPYAALKQGLSPNINYPDSPRLYIPYGHELTWVNTSQDVLRNEWTFADASGAMQTSEAKDLVTPAYDAFSTAPTPTLTGYFESNATEPFSPGFSTMQAGGLLTGKDIANPSAGEVPYEGEFGVGFYDITEPGHKIVVSPEYVGFNPEIDLAWEKIQGVPEGGVDVDALCNMYFYGGAPYGFDYIDVVALIKETIDPEAKIIARVFSVSNDGAIGEEIGCSVLQGKDIPAANPTSYVNLRFEFPVPVNVSSNFLVMLTNPCRDESGNVVYAGNIVFPYVKSLSNPGNTLIYMWRFSEEAGGWNDGFYSLNEFPLSGGLFGGILMTLGASYSDMQLVEEKEIHVFLEGGTETLKVKAHHKPERWALTFDGVTSPEWISHTAAYDEATDTYNVTITVGENPGEPVEADLYLTSPGSMVAIPFTQPGTINSIESVDAPDDKVKVDMEGGDIMVTGANGQVEVYDVAGLCVARATAANGARTAISTSRFPAGVYIVRVNDAVACKIVK